MPFLLPIIATHVTLATDKPSRASKCFGNYVARQTRIYPYPMVRPHSPNSPLSVVNPMNKGFSVSGAPFFGFGRRPCTQIHPCLLSSYCSSSFLPVPEDSGGSHRPLTATHLKSIGIHLPSLSRYFCKSMPSSFRKRQKTRKSRVQEVSREQSCTLFDCTEAQ